MYKHVSWLKVNSVLYGNVSAIQERYRQTFNKSSPLKVSTKLCGPKHVGQKLAEKRVQHVQR